MKNMCKTTNEIGNHRVGERAIPQPLKLQVTWIRYEFCHWKVTKWRYSDLSHETFEFFRYKHKRKKIYVSRGIFHGIPLESDRLCATCRNGQITQDVRKLRFDFPRGYQAFFAELVGFPKIFFLSNRALFPCLHSLI